MVQVKADPFRRDPLHAVSIQAYLSEDGTSMEDLAEGDPGGGGCGKRSECGDLVWGSVSLGKVPYFAGEPIAVLAPAAKVHAICRLCWGVSGSCLVPCGVLRAVLEVIINGRCEKKLGKTQAIPRQSSQLPLFDM